jgi:hypothetical protein
MTPRRPRGRTPREGRTPPPLRRVLPQHSRCTGVSRRDTTRERDGLSLSIDTHDSPGILTKSAFAARRQKDQSTVSKWIERGKISGAALTADGRINVVEAERQLGVTLGTVRSGGKPAAAAARDADDLTLRQRILAVELQQKQRKLDADKGVYVRADQVRAERGRALAKIVWAIDNWLPEVAVELGLDHDGLAALRASWRRLRTRQADLAQAEAEALPELLADAA